MASGNSEEDGPKVWRRSVYIYRKRGLPLPMLRIFDLPDQNISCGARTVSTVPTQALMLMNDEFVLRQAKLFAERVQEAEPNDPGKQIDLAYRIALGREPSADRAAKSARELLAKTAAWLDFAHVLLNLNEFCISEVNMKRFRSRRDFLFESAAASADSAWLLC